MVFHLGQWVPNAKLGSHSGSMDSKSNDPLSFALREGGQGDVEGGSRGIRGLPGGTWSCLVAPWRHSHLLNAIW